MGCFGNLKRAARVTKSPRDSTPSTGPQGSEKCSPEIRRGGAPNLASEARSWMKFGATGAPGRGRASRASGPRIPSQGRRWRRWRHCPSKTQPCDAKSGIIAGNPPLWNPMSPAPFLSVRNGAGPPRVRKVCARQEWGMRTRTRSRLPCAEPGVDASCCDVGGTMKCRPHPGKAETCVVKSPRLLVDFGGPRSLWQRLREVAPAF